MSCSSGIRGGDWCLSSNVHRFYTFNTVPSLTVRRLHQTTAYGKYNHSIVWMLTQFLFINVFTAWHRHISPMNFIIQQSWSFEGVCVPLRLTSCLFPVPDSTYGDRAFPVAAVRIWNSLPQHVSSAPSLPVFCTRLKTYFFELCYL